MSDPQAIAILIQESRTRPMTCDEAISVLHDCKKFFAWL